MKIMLDEVANVSLTQLKWFSKILEMPKKTFVMWPRNYGKNWLYKFWKKKQELKKYNVRKRNSKQRCFKCRPGAYFRFLSKHTLKYHTK